MKELKFGNIFMWGYVEIWRKVACIEKRKDAGMHSQISMITRHDLSN